MTASRQRPGRIATSGLSGLLALSWAGCEEPIRWVSWQELEGDIGFIVQLEPPAVLAGPLALSMGSPERPIYEAEDSPLLAMAIRSSDLGRLRLPLAPDSADRIVLRLEPEVCELGRLLGESQVRVPARPDFALLTPGAKGFEAPSRPLEDFLPDVTLTYPSEPGACGQTVEATPFGSTAALLPPGARVLGEPKLSFEFEDLVPIGRDRVLASTLGALLLFERGAEFQDDPRHAAGPPSPSLVFRDLAVSSDSRRVAATLDGDAGTIVEVTLGDSGIELVRTATSFPELDLNDIAMDESGSVVVVGVLRDPVVEENSHEGVILMAPSIGGPYRLRKTGMEKLVRVAFREDPDAPLVVTGARGGVYVGTFDELGHTTLEERTLEAIGGREDRIWIAGRGTLSLREGMEWTTIEWADSAISPDLYECGTTIGACGNRGVGVTPSDVIEASASSALVSFNECSALGLVRFPDGCVHTVKFDEGDAVRGRGDWRVVRDGDRALVGGPGGRLFELEL